MNPIAGIYHFYVDSFRGLAREVWLLSLVTFINRAGSMVIPFLSLYLTKSMGLSLDQVGWIMSSFGAGSILGSWLGGKLSDQFGYYQVIALSLFSSGLAFIGLQFMQGFIPFCIGVFFLTTLNDSFRPAMFVALRNYSKPENRTRAVTLIRLAINLGFSFGPALGGLIIITLSYKGLFWVDGITCLLAGALFLLKLPSKDGIADIKGKDSLKRRSPYTDRTYLFFLLTTVIITIPFLQYFSTIPLFYNEVHGMSEASIGLLIAFNGLLIFLTEMPLIKWCERQGYSIYSILVASVLFFIVSFILLDIAPVVAVLWVGMTFMTIGEMLNFPFMNRVAMDRSDHGLPGAYMAMFTISWSVAHIIGHNLGMHMVEALGYSKTWYVFMAMLSLGVLMLFGFRAMVRKEEKEESKHQLPEAKFHES